MSTWRASATTSRIDRAAGTLARVVEDSHRLQSTLPDAPDDRTERVRGRLDAIMLAARVAPHTRGIGIVAAADTTVIEPFLLSTQIATLDVVSRGRAGWLVQVSTAARDAKTLGHPQLIQLRLFCCVRGRRT